jgi:hypothetical protein
LTGINKTSLKKRSIYHSVRLVEDFAVMSENMNPKEPEHVSCDLCMKEVPIDVANSFEATDYVVHFCGLECFEKWKQKKQSQQEADN